MSQMLIKKKTLVRVADAFRQRILEDPNASLTILNIIDICYSG
jgi:hypothetical protein